MKGSRALNRAHGVPHVACCAERILAIPGMDDTQLQSFSMPAGPSPSVAGLELILDAAQAAVLLHCSKEHVETLARRGQLPGVKYGRSWVFLATQLQRRIATECARNLEQTVDGAAEPSVRHCQRQLLQHPNDAPFFARTETPIALTILRGILASSGQRRHIVLGIAGVSVGQSVQRIVGEAQWTMVHSPVETRGTGRPCSC
jgi:excisionase family DNA binding protein